MEPHVQDRVSLPPEAVTMAALYTTAHKAELAARKAQADAVAGLFSTLWRAVRGIRVDVGAAGVSPATR